MASFIGRIFDSSSPSSSNNVTARTDAFVDESTALLHRTLSTNASLNSTSADHRYHSLPLHLPGGSSPESLTPSGTDSDEEDFPVNAHLDQLSTEDLKRYSKVLDLFIETLNRVSSGLPVSAGAASTEDVLADISMFIRSPMPSSPAMNAVGITTALNLLTGSRAAVNATIRFREAYAIRDEVGMIEAGLDAPRGVFQLLMGLSYLVYRPAAIATEVLGLGSTAHATSLLGKIAYASVTLGNLFALGFYAIIGAWGAFLSGKILKFRCQMKDAIAGGDQQLLEFFKKKTEVDPSRQLEKLATRRGLKDRVYAMYLSASGYSDTVITHRLMMRVKENLRNEALERFGEGLLKLQGEGSNLSLDDIKWGLSQFSGQMEQNIDALGEAMGLEAGALGNSFLGDDPLAAMGFKMQLAAREQTKLKNFTRFTGAPEMERVQTALQRGLAERLENEETRAAAELELRELETSILKANSTQLLVHVTMAVFGILGIPVMIMSFMSLAPILSTVYIGLSMVLAALMFSTDSYYLAMGMDPSGKPGKYDKACIIAIAVIMAAVLGVSIGLTVTYGLPLLPLILTGIFCAIAFGGTGFAYHKLDQKEKRWEYEHPSLEEFHAMLQDETIPLEETLNRFKFLGPEVRAAIRTGFEQSHFVFSNPRHEAMNGGNQFGENLFDQWASSVLFDEDKPKFAQAVDKTVKHFWAQLRNAKTAEEKTIAKENAKAAQMILDALKREEAGMIETDVAFLMRLKNNPVVLARLSQNIYYVFMRADSREKMLSVVGNVLEAANEQVPAQDPLSEFADEISGLARSRLHREAAAASPMSLNVNYA